MASLIDIYNNNKEQYEIKNKNADKTPLSNDGGKNIIANDTFVDEVRGGVVPSTKPYSTTVKY